MNESLVLFLPNDTLSYWFCLILSMIRLHVFFMLFKYINTPLGVNGAEHVSIQLRLVSMWVKVPFLLKSVWCTTLPHSLISKVVPVHPKMFLFRLTVAGHRVKLYCTLLTLQKKARPTTVTRGLIKANLSSITCKFPGIFFFFWRRLNFGLKKLNKLSDIEMSYSTDAKNNITETSFANRIRPEPLLLAFNGRLLFRQIKFPMIWQWNSGTGSRSLEKRPDLGLVPVPCWSGLILWLIRIPGLT